MNVDSEKMAETCLKIGVLFSIVCTFLFWGNWIAIFFAWVAALPLAFVIAFIAGFVLNAMGATLGETTIAVAPVEMEIIEYGQVLGKIDGLDMYEYLTVQYNGATKKLNYLSMFDRVKGFTPEYPGWFLVCNNAIYIEPENTKKLEA